MAVPHKGEVPFLNSTMHHSANIKNQIFKCNIKLIRRKGPMTQAAGRIQLAFIVYKPYVRVVDLGVVERG